MFRITEDPLSGSLVQYLAKVTSMVLSCPLTWSMLWQHIVTRCVLQYAALTPTTAMLSDTTESFL